MAFNLVFLTLNIWQFTDKSKDTSRYMEVANKRGNWIVKLFVKVFAIICPAVILLKCIQSAAFSHFKIGYIRTEDLYYPFNLE